MANHHDDAATEKLRRALRVAAPADIEFSEENLQVHSQRRKTNVGCRPIAVCGIPLPLDIEVVYVRVLDESGRYWYVRSSEDATVPKEVLAASEAEARQAVLGELQRIYLGKPLSQSG